MSGPGIKLTYEACKDAGSINGLYIETSTDNENWTQLGGEKDVKANSWGLFSGTTWNWTEYSVDINNTAIRYIRFRTKTGATLVKYYRNVKVTRATTLSTSTTSLDFGTVTNRRSSTPQNALIDYNNTTYDQQVTGTCTDPNFTVTATTVGAYGSNQAVPIVFTPTTAGTHNGTVTLTMNGKTVTFSVTGVGQTTYYTRATASATEGGSAYVSFTSFDEATRTSDTKNSGVTTASSATATAYYRAVPNKRYAFVGWKRNLSDATCVSTDEEFQTTYDYDSENSSTPTSVTYYAVFEEKPNAITLEPANSEYDTDSYETVTLHRTLLQGYNTIALPFATTVAELTGRTSADDWVAQISSVTYNQHDGFTLFFERVTNGRIQAFEPYVLHLGTQVVNPSWANIDLPAAAPSTITPAKGYGTAASPDGSSYADWQMSSNFTAGMPMAGKYGIVNAIGALQRGGNTSTINAFTAYITPPVGSAGVKVQSAFTDEWGETTYIQGVPDRDNPAARCSTGDFYDLSGRRIDANSQPLPGIYVRDGRRIVVK